MRDKENTTSVEISKATREKLRGIHRFGDTYDSIISSLCDTNEESLKSKAREGYRSVSIPGLMYTEVCMADPGMSSFLNGLQKIINIYKGKTEF